MELKEKMLNILNDIANHGWRDLILNITKQQLDLNQLTLKNIDEQLTKSLNIERTFPGFQDFSNEGEQAITSRLPSRSLLFHAFASSNVLWSDKNQQNKLTQFPTLNQLEITENYVFGIKPPSLQDIINEYGQENLAVVVFANQYRTAVDTPHKLHADLVYSRTGISRVGTETHFYNKEKRSFDPLSDDPTKIRVLPAKYNPYIAVRRSGSSNILGRRLSPCLPIRFSDVPPDQELDFWIPIHKLFTGSNCLQDLDLNFSQNCSHSNEKIAKIHQYISGPMSSETGSSPSDHDKFPFKFQDGIATFNNEINLVIPEPHKALVGKAKDGNKLIGLDKTFTMAKQSPENRHELIKNRNSLAMFSSSLELRESARSNPFSEADTGAQRSVPEYAHIRTKIINNEELDLNIVPAGQENYNVTEEVAENKYKALHYVDFTGDGFVEVNFNEGSFDFSDWQRINAYSIVAPPDYFPYCDQIEIFDNLRHRGIWSRSPQALCDIRLLPNIQSHPELFFPNINPFDTCTALVCADIDRTETQFVTKMESRISYLTDAAAGVFAPGWDTSFDMIKSGMRNFPHLAAYGLGSPFPEDAKLCAAISSFWPAVAPDIARSYWPEAQNRRTIIPLTDVEIGTENSSGWDGEHGPIILTEGQEEFITYKKFEYVDYTLNALHNKFNYHLLANIDTVEYMDRVNRFAIANSKLKGNFILIGFKKELTDFVFKFMISPQEVESSNIKFVKLKITESTIIRVKEDGEVIFE